MIEIVWEFETAARREAEFEAAYGPEGSWARFFRGGRGYLGTRLLRDVARPGRYLTIDRWESRAAYERFRSEHAAEYQALDRECEALTARETPLGTFEVL